MIWPAEMIERAKQMWADGYTGSQIGVAIGVTRNAVIGQAHRRKWGARGPESPLRGLSRRQHRYRPRPEKPKRKASVRTNPTFRAKPKLVMTVMPVEPSPETAVMLMSLTPRSCRFPVGEATGRDQLFCGSGKKIEHSYCVYHQWRAYGIGTPSERRAHEVVA